jgi:hypothetical protein
MAHCSRKKAVLVSFICLIAFIFLCAGSALAVQANPSQPVEITKMQPLDLSKIQIMKRPTVKIAPKTMIKIPANVADRKADLSCTINAYYDVNRMRSIQNHLWHLNPGWYQPPLPYPWCIEWEIVVMNNGTAPAENFAIRLIFTLTGGAPNVKYETETLAPGEAAVIKYYSGPFAPGNNPGLVNRIKTLYTVTDATAKIAESNESNNNCNYQVRFVYP